MGAACEWVGVDLSDAAFSRGVGAFSPPASPHKQKIQESLGLGRRFAEAKNAVKEAVEAVRDAVVRSCPRVFGELLACGVQRSSAVVVLGVPLALGTVGGKEAEAGHIRDISLEPQHNLLGNRPGTFFVEARYQDPNFNFLYYFSTFPVGKQIDVTTGQEKTFFYVPYHGYGNSNGFQSLVALGDGRSYLNDRGNVYSNLTIEYQSPIFNPFQPNINAGDITIVSITSQGPIVPDSVIPTLAPVGGAVQGDIAFVAGFSRLSTPATGFLPATGDSYGYYASIQNAVPLNVDGASHRNLFFSVNSLIEFNGASNTGGSGSWVFNSAGELIGAVVAGTGGPNDLLRGSIIADFTRFGTGGQLGYREQVLPFSGITYVPAPTTGLTVIGGALFLMRRERRK